MVTYVRTYVWNVFRIKTKAINAPIIVELTTVHCKENLLTSFKKFNKDKQNKLNTEHLRIQGTSIPIYISENLTAKTKRLFFLARGAASHLDFKFCWTSRGKVFLRRNEGSPHILVQTEQDIHALNKHD